SHVSTGPSDGCALSRRPFVTAYTMESSLYLRLNSLCRGVRDASHRAELNERFRFYYAGLERELLELPTSKTVCYRGISFGLARSLFVPGSVMTLPSFTSATVNLGVALSFIGGAPRPV